MERQIFNIIYNYSIKSLAAPKILTLGISFFRNFGCAEDTHTRN